MSKPWDKLRDRSKTVPMQDGTFYTSCTAASMNLSHCCDYCAEVGVGSGGTQTFRAQDCLDAAGFFTDLAKQLGGSDV